jgi:hypothetical protein
MKNQIKSLIKSYTKSIERLEATINEHSSYGETQRVDSKVRIYRKVIQDLTNLELQG